MILGSKKATNGWQLGRRLGVRVVWVVVEHVARRLQREAHPRPVATRRQGSPRRLPAARFLTAARTTISTTCWATWILGAAAIGAMTPWAS
jgi:hypothetical protein